MQTIYWILKYEELSIVNYITLEINYFYLTSVKMTIHFANAF